MKAKGKLGELNRNVRIFGNTFEYVRDNPIEPEGTAANWWMHHNRFLNVHALFSFTEANLSHMFIFSNTGRLITSPCPKGSGMTHCGGKIFKFEPVPPFPSGPIFAFHNSWYTRNSLVTKGPSRNFIHINNAIHFKKRAKRFLRDNGWHPSYLFDFDISNHSFDELLIKNQQEKSGIVAKSFFKSPRKGDFRMKKSSPAIDKAKVLNLFGWTQKFEGKGPDIGAFEGDRLHEGPRFQVWDAVKKVDVRKLLK